MKNHIDWLNSDNWIAISPQEFSKFSGVSLKGVHLLIENNYIDYIFRDKKPFIPVPSITYYALQKAETLGSSSEINWTSDLQTLISKKATA